ncbi:MAG: hypothetical protein PWR27_2345 [Petroclostridium sp.]|jgi:glycosyltransferase involved in cell wall biosynthesis|nr:hypothetical protein [Petroclostridium sp.]
MKILVLATDYPDNNGNITLMYIHTRNKYYIQNGIDVTVLNFKANENYIIDDVKVITLQEYIRGENEYDILVSHAPNIRNHYTFLKKYDENFKKVVFFFHGHEVLKLSETYPKPYEYMPMSSKASMFYGDVYDYIKLKIWKKYFTRKLSKLYFIFVSNWMYNMFLKYVKVNPKLISEKTRIIYNSIGSKFETNSYEIEGTKDYDFITIRNNLDGSKYCIDVVSRVATSNPNYKFCVIGKGEFFNYNTKPKNLEWIDRTLSHAEITDYLNRARCAFIPTRTDAQGVMACELATFGIPLITSDIEVCREVFRDFNNVEYIDNEAEEINLDIILEKIDSVSCKKNTKYYAENTIGKEIELYKLLKGN